MAEPPTIIHEEPLRFAKPDDELRHSFLHNGVPLAISCRFLSLHTGSFSSPTSFVHPSPFVTRIFMLQSGTASIVAANHQYTLIPGRFYVLPAHMPFKATYDTRAICTYHVHVYDESGTPVLEPTCGVLDLCEPALWGLVIEAFERHDFPCAQVLGFRAIEQIIAASLDGLTIKQARAGRYREIITQILQAPSAELSVEHFAAQACQSVSALSKGFQRAIGGSLKEFIQMSLVRKAQEQLTYTDASITQVASELGFSDPSYFSRWFKRRTGATPLAYRRGDGGG